jgi:hypothetical protein
MPVTIHYVNIQLVKLDAVGALVGSGNVSTPTVSMNGMLNFTTEHRIMPDNDVPSSLDYPTIKQYLINESSAGFSVIQVAQSFIVTQKVT